MKLEEICTLIKKSRGMNYQTRWNMYPKVRQESISEHTFNVALFTLAVLYIIRDGSLNYPDYETVVGSLLHDVEEAVTGDIPTLTKRCNHNEEGLLVEAKKELSIDKLGTIDYLFKFFRDNNIVRLADGLAALWFAAEQEECGIKLFEHIKNQIATKLVAEYSDVFPQIKEFIAGIGITYTKEDYTLKFTHVGEYYANKASKPTDSSN